MKSKFACALLLSILILSACMKSPINNQVNSENIQEIGTITITGKTIIHTSIGDLEIVSSRFVEEVHDRKPGPEEKILLIIVTKPGAEQLNPSDISLEEFQNMVSDNKGQIYILGDDGSKTITTMAGWVDEEMKEFAIGFVLPKTITTYKLYWPENDPIILIPQELAAQQVAASDMAKA